jgi:hypothetical protein
VVTGNGAALKVRKANSDDLAELGARAGELLAEIAAGGHLEPGLARRLSRVEDAVRLGIVECPRGDRQADGDVGDLAIGGDVGGALLAEGAKRLVHVLVLLQRLDRVIDRLLVRP